MSLIEPINSHQGSKRYGNNPESRIWKPLLLGPFKLDHRIFLAPLTRMRAIGQIPCNEAVEYYQQRATKGGLLITEATFISLESSGYPNAPGIYNEQQLKQWTKIVDAVHAKGSIIYCQLWNIGVANKGEMSNVPIIGPGNVDTAMKNIVTPMTTEEIQKHLADYRHAAEMAIKAGFDGVEVHGAHGYLLEQFLHPSLNNCRTDQYSSKTLENRARFMMEAVEAVVNVVGESKVAIRLSPFFSMGLNDYDPFETFGYVCEQLVLKFPRLSYISLTEPRWRSTRVKEFSNDYFRAIIRGISPTNVSKTEQDSQFQFPDPTDANPIVIISAGGYSPSDGESTSERTGDVVGFGRLFISNPDLVYRIRNGLELNSYDRSTFYSQNPVIGYTDYPFSTKESNEFIPINELDPVLAASRLSSALEAQRKRMDAIIIENEQEKTALRIKIAKLEQ